MPEVFVADGVLTVGGRRVPLCGGEIHYWRLSPARWPDVLAAVRRLGVRVVATYVPWQYHELAPGQFDFHGSTEPARNLVGFLELLRAQGFDVFIRPGPFIYSEWVNAGVPDRVVTLPRLSEAYRREARVWMQAVTDVLRPFFATRGGPIALFQPDNEMDLFSHWFEEECGLGAGQGPQPPTAGDRSATHGRFFQQFLRSAYGDVAALNAAWGTQYARIDDAEAQAVRVNDFDPHTLTRHKDFWRFQHWATAEALRWHVETYRELGVDLPMVANYYPGGDVQNWREVSKVCDLVGIDWYPRNEFGGEALEHRKFLDTCRYQRVISRVPYIAEFECGVWHGFHDYTGALQPNHYRLMGCSALLAGIQGFNWYMLGGRDNWYFTPINERGELRGELAEVFINFHRVVDEIAPATLKKLTRAAVVVEPVHVGTDRVWATNPVLDALYAADLDFEIFDPELSPVTPPADAARPPGQVVEPVLFYSSADWLPRASQARLVEYMEDGGTLVVFQRGFPQRDENFQPHNGLSVVTPDRVLSPLGKKVELDLGGHRAAVEGAVWCWDNPPGEALTGTQVAGRQQAVENADKWMTNYIGKRWVCGYRQPRGRGALVVLGLPPSAALMRTIHEWLKLPLYAQAALPSVQTGLFERGGEYVLIATNMNPAPIQTRVTLSGVTLPERVVVRDLWTSQERTARRDELVVDLPRRSGGVWTIRGA